jgi:hypothetical protein
VRDPLVPPRLEQDQAVERVETVVQLAQRAFLQLAIAAVHQPEGVLVEAEPDVQAVLLDAPFGRPAARALAAQAPAALVDRDGVAVAQLLRGGQLERRGQSRGPAAEHGHIDFRQTWVSRLDCATDCAIPAQ